MAKRTVEEAVIEQIRKAARQLPQHRIRIGIGDDTAVLRAPRAGRELLLTTDQIIENTHFVMDRHPAQALGYKTLARGLSDIAAMGGTPVCFLLSLSMPETLRFSWLNQYINGMFRLCIRRQIPCVGGDVARGQNFGADVVVVGDVERGKALTRAGASPGDLLYVSGTLGGSSLGLSRLLDNARSRGAAVERHLLPEPRLDLGQFLREKLKATAAMDLSDGLSTDLSRLARASGVKIELDAAAVPVFPGASLDQALHGGEDYELVFTVRPRTRVPAMFEGLRLSCIGRLLPGAGLVLRKDGTSKRLKPSGFQHFGHP